MARGDRPSRGNVLSVDDEPPVGAEKAIPGQPPPGEITDDQMAMIREGIHLVVDIPDSANPKKKVGVRAISRQEQLLARAQARRDAKQLFGGEDGEIIPDIEENCFRDEIVQRALVKWPTPRGDEDPEPLFASVETMRVEKGVAELEYYYECYARHEAWSAPIMRAEAAGNVEMFKVLTEELRKKKGEEVRAYLTRLPHATLVQWLLSTEFAGLET
jgi:hypothetical protein